MSRMYTAERLHCAMLDLIGEGSLNDRVFAALTNARTLRSSADDFPDPDDRHKWEELQARLTAVTPFDQSEAYRVAVDAMRDTELKEVAATLLALFSSAAQELGADNEERRGIYRRRR